MAVVDEVIAFWLTEVGPKGWYSGGDALDATIRERYLPLWQSAYDCGLRSWLTRPRGVLAYLIVTDQFPRNMFRSDAQAFATDAMALRTAKQAIDQKTDLKVGEPERQFFYMPLMHSECLTDQDRSVRMMLTRMPETGASNLLHAKAHREIIRKFGRFPYRNDAFGRESTEDENRFINQGGYGRLVKSLGENAR